MSNTQYKSKNLAGLDPLYPAIGSLVGNTLLRWAPFGALMRAQDTIPATSRRIIGEWHLSGAEDWQQPNGTVDPTTGTYYPDPTVWRTIATFRSHVTPGCELRAQYLFCPAGQTTREILGGAAYQSGGAFADLRVRATWANGVSTSGPTDWIRTMPGAVGGTYGGLEPQGDGQAWAVLSEGQIDGIRPDDYLTDPAEAATYSEWSDVTVALAVRGGSRLVHVIVYEYPLAHVTLHSDDGLTSVHAHPASNVPLIPRPMERAPDGATYEEHRHGTRRVAQVAERQSERLGPRLLQWTSWNEAEANLFLEVEHSPITVTASTWVELGSAEDGSPITAYSLDAPGWISAGAHAKLARTSEPGLISHDRFGVVPVRVRVDGRPNLGAGLLRVQCGLYDWVEVECVGTRGVYTATGYLQTQVHADHDAPPMVVLARTDGSPGANFEIFNVFVDFGEWA